MPPDPRCGALASSTVAAAVRWFVVVLRSREPEVALEPLQWVPVTSKEVNALELDRTIKRTAPGFVWKRTETASPAGSRNDCLVRYPVPWFVFTPPAQKVRTEGPNSFSAH